MLVVTGCGLAVPALAQYAIDHGITRRRQGRPGAGRGAVRGARAWSAGSPATSRPTSRAGWASGCCSTCAPTPSATSCGWSWATTSARRPAARVSRLTSDIEALDQLVTDGVTSLVINGLTFIGVVGDPVRLRRRARPADVRDLPAAGDRARRSSASTRPAPTGARASAWPTCWRPSRRRSRACGSCRASAARSPPSASSARSTRSTARRTCPRSASRAPTSRASSCSSGIGTAIILYFGATGCSTRT